jgi:hypothetical protein
LVERSAACSRNTPAGMCNPDLGQEEVGWYDHLRCLVSGTYICRRKREEESRMLIIFREEAGERERTQIIQY